MKKEIVIFCALLYSIAGSMMSCSNPQGIQDIPTPEKVEQAALLGADFQRYLKEVTVPDLVYKVESRFMTTLTKARVDQATSILDLLPEEATQGKEHFHRVEVTVFGDEQELIVSGETEVLNEEQLALLRSTSFSTDIRITASCKKRNAETHVLEGDTVVYYMTITPTQEVAYAEGQAALIQYLRTSTQKETAIVKEDKLQPGRVRFTVTTEGTLANVRLDATSGYPAVDEVLIQRMTQLPGTWLPATNAQGEPVDQELVFFFGSMGC